MSCYTGAAGTQSVGTCKAGTKTCNASGTAYGACTGEVVPAAESCKTSGDEDCDGQSNEGCSALTCNAWLDETFDDGVANTQTGTYYKADWCNETVPTSPNTPACQTGRTMRTNDSSSSGLLWISKTTASCTSVKLSYKWYQFASSTSSIEYQQSNDLTENCSKGGSFTTAVSSASLAALQTCNTGTVTIPFGSSTGVYIRFKNGNFSNNAMWWDYVTVDLLGCDC